MDMRAMKALAVMEIAADDWWDSLTMAEQEAYKKAHPGSKYDVKHTPWHIGTPHPKTKDHHKFLDSLGFSMSSKISDNKGGGDQSYDKMHVTMRGPVHHRIVVNANGGWDHQYAKEENTTHLRYKPSGYSGKDFGSLTQTRLFGKHW